LTEQRNFTADSFYKFISEKKLMGSRCKKCQAMYLPPHPVCIKCHGTDMEWVELKGTGKLAAFTAISVGPTCTVAEGHDRNNPYLAGIVKMDEGPKICGRILGIDPKSPEKIKVGTPLRLGFPEQKSGATTYLNFRVQ
jgi:scaffold protein (connect acetoacetyl-CoA thiolase and HMG-CoA synthase)